MFRRALSSLLPALFALAFLCGTPGTSVGGPEASAAAWIAGAAASPAIPIARGGLTQDVPDGALCQRADQDDTPDDRIIRVVSTVEWPDSARGPPLLGSDETVGPTHRPCAAPPRAPPFA